MPWEGIRLTPQGNESPAGCSQDGRETVGRWSLSSPLPGRFSPAGKPLGCDGVLTARATSSGAGDYLDPGCGVLKTSCHHTDYYSCRHGSPPKISLRGVSGTHLPLTEKLGLRQGRRGSTGFWWVGKREEAWPPYTLGCGQNAELGLLCMNHFPFSSEPGKRLAKGDNCPHSLTGLIHTQPHTQS